MDRATLVAAGVDYDEGVERFAGMSQLYEKYLGKFFDEYGMDELSQQIDAQQISAAFETAHALKGAAGNLSLNRFYDQLCQLVELLRRGESAQTVQPALAQTRALFVQAERAVKGEGA